VRLSLGLLAVSFFVIHMASCAWAGRLAESLWACHVGAALVGMGLLGDWPRTTAIGILWLSVGTPLWLLDIASGAEFVPTSALTHVGGLAVALAALRRRSVPRHIWWQAVLALAALQQACRWWTPPAANVNAAFAVYPRFQAWFPSYGLYLAASAFVAGLLFWIIAHLLRRGAGPGWVPL
jgi:hypothetical protein